MCETGDRPALGTTLFGASRTIAVDEHLNRQTQLSETPFFFEMATTKCFIANFSVVCRREGCTTAAFDRAAMNNHVDVVLWLTENRTEGGTESALQFSASRGHTKVNYIVGGCCPVALQPNS